MGESYNSYTATRNSDTFSSSSFQYQQQALENSYVNPLPAHQSALHSIRKFPATNVITKKPMNAHLASSCSKIYKVDPVDFRDVVQRLTGTAEFRSTWLHEAAPVSPSPSQLGISGSRLLAGEEARGPRKTAESDFGAN
ncbi:hypothetical protein OROGR_028584 [Orobanche gracilis]